MYAIEHPNVDMSHFFPKLPRPTFDTFKNLMHLKFNAKAANNQLDALKHPFKLFSPVRAATGCGRNF